MHSVALVLFSLLHAAYGKRVRTSSQMPLAEGDTNAAELLAQLLLSLQPDAAFNLHPAGVQSPTNSPSLAYSRPAVANMEKLFVMQDSSLGDLGREVASIEEEAAAEQGEELDTNTTEKEAPTRGWRYANKFPTSPRKKELDKKVEKTRRYSTDDAIALMKQLSNAKFVETAELHAKMDLDPKYNDQQIRSTVTLPHGTGKSKRVAVLVPEGPMEEEAKAAGADLVGMDSLVEDISAGKLDFDVLLATPPAMPKIAKLGKILGPKGLMPSPKAGTVTTTVGDTVKEFKAGKLEFRMDKTGIVHVPFGKVDFSDEQLKQNLRTLVTTIQKNKPTGSKGKMWQTATVSSTMGPGIKLDLDEIFDWF